MEVIKSGDFFEVTIKTDRIDEKGIEKKATETYTVLAPTFGEAERIVLCEVGRATKGEVDVTAIKRADYKETVFPADGCVEEPCKWYKTKINYITVDERTGREKKEGKTYLIAGDTLDKISPVLDDIMQGTMTDWEKAKIQETKIEDVIIPV